MRYRVDYFTTKHIKRFFFTYDEAHDFAFKTSCRTDVASVFILEAVDMDKCIYDVIEQI